VTRGTALVFGGTGTVGREVLRGLARAGVRTTFTYHRSRERADALAAELSQRALEVDLADPEATRRLVRELPDRPDVFVHAAAVADADWTRTLAVNGQSAYVAIEELFRREKRETHVVLVGALDRAQSLPLPVPFAASQGLLSAMTMAFAKELGAAGLRINMVALGVLDQGLSATLDPRLRSDFLTFSALRRNGTASEAARSILWLALESTFMSGRVLAVNGGI
jgi:3-oxoacyl-[acyl-carrier protein] reductase